MQIFDTVSSGTARTMRNVRNMRRPKRRQPMSFGKMVLFGVAAVGVWAFLASLPDMRRYLRIERM